MPRKLAWKFHPTIWRVGSVLQAGGKFWVHLRNFSQFLVVVEIFVKFLGVWGFLWVWCKQRETALYESGVGKANGI